MMMKKKWGILASACCCCCNRALMSNFLFCVATATTGDDRAPPKARPSSLFSILFFHFNITRVYLWSLQIPESVRRHKKKRVAYSLVMNRGSEASLMPRRDAIICIFFSRWSIPNSWQVFFLFLLSVPVAHPHRGWPFIMLCCLLTGTCRHLSSIYVRARWTIPLLGNRHVSSYLDAFVFFLFLFEWIRKSQGPCVSNGVNFAGYSAFASLTHVRAPIVLANQIHRPSSFLEADEMFVEIQWIQLYFSFCSCICDWRGRKMKRTTSCI